MDGLSVVGEREPNGGFASLGQGLFTGSGLVSVLFSPVYFGVRRAHKGCLSSKGARHKIVNQRVNGGCKVDHVGSLIVGLR